MTVGPKPKVVTATWDDHAFRDYFATHPVEEPEP